MKKGLFLFIDGCGSHISSETRNCAPDKQVVRAEVNITWVGVLFIEAGMSKWIGYYGIGERFVGIKSVS